MIDTAWLFFVFGAVTGSFLNVCIVRVPKEKSVIFPRSHCIHCQKIIPWYDNIPLVSYLLLKGRCRFCHGKISVRYFIVELMTAALFMAFYQHVGLRWILLAYLVLLSGLIVTSFIDIELRIIPDEISLGGIVVGFIFSLLIPEMQGVKGIWQAAGQSLLGILIGGGAIYLIGVIGDFVFRKESMGGGDVKLLAMIGAFLGWKAALLTFFLAPFFGMVVGVIVKIRTNESLIPYGPFLAMAAIISVVWGDSIIKWILSGYGLY